jgi:hypothetical protein
MKVQFKPEIFKTLEKRYVGYTFQLTNVDNDRTITYYKDFTKYKYFKVKDISEYYYKIISPKDLDMYVLYKGHVMPADFELEDSIFEWEE